MERRTFEDDDVPKRGQGAKYKLDHAVRDHLSLLRAWFVVLELVGEEAEHVLQEKELGLVELGEGKHVAHQRVSATRTEISTLSTATILLEVQPRIIGTLESRCVRIYVNGKRRHCSLGAGLRD